MEDLQKQINELKFKLDMVIKPDVYLFQRDIDFLNSHIGRTALSQIGFYGLTPIIQPSSTGEGAGVNVGGGVTLDHLATFNGHFGTTAYTISDIVKHLKQLGLILK